MVIIDTCPNCGEQTEIISDGWKEIDYAGLCVGEGEPVITDSFFEKAESSICQKCGKTINFMIDLRESVVEKMRNEKS